MVRNLDFPCEINDCKDAGLITPKDIIDLEAGGSDTVDEESSCSTSIDTYGILHAVRKRKWMARYGYVNRRPSFDDIIAELARQRVKDEQRRGAADCICHRRCNFWSEGNCKYRNDECKFLHSNSFGDIGLLAHHKEATMGITVSYDGKTIYTVPGEGEKIIVREHRTCIWNWRLHCNILEFVKEGWNTNRVSSVTELHGPKGLVRALVYNENMIFAGAEDGVIVGWLWFSNYRGLRAGYHDGRFEYRGHMKPIVGLVIESGRLYSASIDQTIRVEYKVIVGASCDSIWIQENLNDMGLQQQHATSTYCDNQSLLKMVKKISFYAWMKHIKVHHQFIREKVHDKHIELLYCATQEQVADIFTKEDFPYSPRKTPL